MQACLAERKPFELRQYQSEAVDAGVDFLTSKKKYNGLMVLPTGSGKSLVIAGIANRLNAPVLIFQPSKEILEQNHGKYEAYGYSAAIYSASKNRKEIGKVTFATIGSVKSKPGLFADFPYIIIDECHGVNAKGGMYRDFLESIGKVRVLGLTATPYRLVTDGFGGSILKFLTRTRPRIFRELVYHVQNGDLFKQGFLSPLRYRSSDGFDRSQVKLNSTGADFDENSLRRYYRGISFPDKVAETLTATIAERRNALVFTAFLDESRHVVSKVSGSVIVTGETPKAEREKIINGFRSGRIKAVCNVGVLTTGFDYPELETIILARPTMSLALYYQMIGRGIRPHPDKKYAEVVDMCGNTDLFGKVEDLRLVDGENGKWYIASGRRKLTNIYYGDRR